VAGMQANGPVVWGGFVIRRKHRAGSRYPAPAGPESCHAAPHANTVRSGGAGFKLREDACPGATTITDLS